MKSSDIKLKIIAITLALISAYMTGRYTAGPQTKASTTAVVDTVKDTDTTKVTTTTEAPNGTKTITTTEHTIAETNRTSKTQSQITQTPLAPKWNVSVLASTDLSHLNRALIPSYGLSVSKEVLGSITAGVYAMDNGIVGLSLGFNF